MNTGGMEFLHRRTVGARWRYHQSFGKMMCRAGMIGVVAMGMAAFADDTPKQDIKQAGKDTKQAAKNTAKATKKETKKDVNKAAKSTEKGAKKVEKKTNPSS